MQKQQLLKQQVQALVDGAGDPQTRWAVQVTGQVLLGFAQKLAHTHYWLVTHKAGYWQSVHLSNIHAPEQEKTVIYAFADLTSANIERLQSAQPQELICCELPVLEILFRCLALREIDSIVFFDRPFHTDKGTEVARSLLSELCQKQLAKHRIQIV
ncbi:MAG: hypothetical protein ACK4QL_04385 [Pseudanabaenaceae cyanobacterium]